MGGLVVQVGTFTTEDGVLRVRAPVFRRTHGRHGWHETPVGAIIFATPVGNVERIAESVQHELEGSPSPCL